MAFTFDATPSGTAANSWALVAEGDDYFAGRLNASAWSALTTAEKEIALVHGTRELERIEFAGYRVAINQALQVPRALLYDTDDRALPTTVVPQVFKEALFEHVLYLLNQGATDPTQPTGLEMFSSLEVPGAVRLDLRDGAKRAPYAKEALKLLAPYIVEMPGSTRLVRA